MNRARTLAAGAATLLLAACAALAPDARVPSAAAFDVIGRMLVSYDGRAFSSGFRWRHDGDGDEIWLLSPVGQALAHIVADNVGATLTGADGKSYHARSVEGLTRDALGWPLPLDYLQHWIHGAAAPGAGIRMERDTRSRVSMLEQANWRVRYAYPESGDAVERPRRLDLARDGQQLRLIIDTWHSGGAR